MTHTNHKYTNPSEFCLLLFRCITKKFQKHYGFDEHRNHIIHNNTKSHLCIILKSKNCSETKLPMSRKLRCLSFIQKNK